MPPASTSTSRALLGFAGSSLIGEAATEISIGCPHDRLADCVSGRVARSALPFQLVMMPLRFATMDLRSMASSTSADNANWLKIAEEWQKLAEEVDAATATRNG